MNNRNQRVRGSVPPVFTPDNVSSCNRASLARQPTTAENTMLTTTHVASRELHDAFNALLTSPAQRGLVVGIRNERLIPTFIIPSTSPDFLEDFSVLDSILDENEAAYILLRKYDAAPDGYVAITYVPDTAPVRSKMLFASTRLTLMRELGTERFRDSLFATTKVEMGREGWERHERHERVEAPLTEEESALAGIKRAEAEVGRGTTDRSSHVSSGLNFVISEDALEALKGLGTDDGHNLIQLVGLPYVVSNLWVTARHPAIPRRMSLTSCLATVTMCAG